MAESAGRHGERMKVLLIEPPVRLEEMYASGGSEVGGTIPPLGMAYIASYLEQRNIGVGIIDGTAENKDVYEIAKEAKGYDIIGITSITFFALRVHEQAKAIKETCPGKTVIVGGPHASAIPAEVLEDENIDIVVIGEGELTTYELVRHIEANGLKDLGRIDGIAYRENGKAVINRERELIRDLDSLPFPARHLLKMGKYSASKIRSSHSPSLSIIGSRGCPFRCSFCWTKVSNRKCVRMHSAKYVVDEMEEVISKYGAKEINMWDDCFTLDRKRVHEICRLMKERGIHIPIEFNARVDNIDLPMLKEMKERGFYLVGFGIESGNDRVLKTIMKDATTDQVRAAFKICRDAKMLTRGFLILGFVGETEKEMMDTIEFAKEIRLDYATFALLIPLPGTLDYERAQTEGTFDRYYYKKEILSDIELPAHPVYLPKGFTEERLMKIHRLSYKSFYFRPSYILTQIMNIRSFDDIKRMIDGGLTVMKLR